MSQKTLKPTEEQKRRLLELMLMHDPLRAMIYQGIEPKIDPIPQTPGAPMNLDSPMPGSSRVNRVQEPVGIDLDSLPPRGKRKNLY